MKKHVVRILFDLAVVVALVTIFFRGQIHLAEEGSIIITKTPEYRLNPDTDRYCYFYEMTINFDKITVVMEEPELPLQLVSDKLGTLEIDILKDLREGKNTLKRSEYLEKVNASAYSKEQINLLYEYFGCCYDTERKYFKTPDYDYSMGDIYIIVVVIAIIVEFWWKLRKEYRDDGEEVSFAEKLVLCVVNLGVLLYVMISAKVTFWH